MVYINNGEHDNLNELPKDNLEVSLDTVYNDYTYVASHGSPSALGGSYPEITLNYS